MTKDSQVQLDIDSIGGVRGGLNNHKGVIASQETGHAYIARPILVQVVLAE